MTLCIDLPFPNSALFPNRTSGKAWASLRKLKDAARDMAYVLTKQAATGFVAPVGTLHLTMTFRPPDNRHRDLDNMLAASKHQIDGIALALGVDDKLFNPIILRAGPPIEGGAIFVAIV